MKVFLTGASSFTGYWIARVLAERGHDVVASFSGSREDYQEGRSARVAGLADLVDCRFGLTFGSNAFAGAVAEARPDVMGLHGAEVTNYRSWDFDPLEAARRNTQGVRSLFGALPATSRVVATGSVFEPYEGIGDPTERTFNPYGLSKMISYELFRMEAERAGLPLLKFVIPNPFGVFEERRFTYYLVSEWSAGRTPRVGTPDYVRDNIHVELLAASYAVAVEAGPKAQVERVRPSGYIETQGSFAKRFANEMAARWGLDLPVELACQSDFSEPRIRVNDMPAVELVTDWNEALAWDGLARYYAPLCLGSG